VILSLDIALRASLATGIIGVYRSAVKDANLDLVTKSLVSVLLAIQDITVTSATTNVVKVVRRDYAILTTDRAFHV